MLLNLHKPAGITSHDAVNYIRRLTGEARVGHGGTLDPFAEGVLVIGIGRESTKKLHQILKGTDKEYLATLELGKTSITGDPEGEIKNMASDEEIKSLTDEKIKKVLKNFTGEIEQRPPAYSAVKIKGVPAYKLARQGITPALTSRKIVIKELELLEFIPPLVKIRAVVSAGTYIRSLAEDIGQALGVGAYLQALIRTRVGEYTLEQSRTLEELQEEYAK
ncbi:MAG: tRNA pseudouridine(55) synthase TruB [Candidatus Colwellbacteria bacterium]|nr:tRNA pseudouridine(55) synthase TruB [Candidatus Colwellbacteria bacterium]